MVAVGDGRLTAGTIIWRGVGVGAARTGPGEAVGTVLGWTGSPSAAPASWIRPRSTTLLLPSTV